ncbi:MAG: acetate kinase, partial [Candidatus Phytoplasma sp.]|nr:acetate kinase [Phytoplasma sp.]
MMKIMAVNAGSSSLKFQLFNMPEETTITSGIVERIGHNDAVFSIKFNGEKHEEVLPVLNHKVAVELLFDALIKYNVIKSLNEIEGVGHRVVQGGELFTDSSELTEENILKIESLNDLAPLHNPAHVIGIRAFKEALPNVFQIAVFDTTFHQSMPKENFMYATPYEWYTKYGIRKYGAHGT